MLQCLRILLLTNRKRRCHHHRELATLGRLLSRYCGLSNHPNIFLMCHFRRSKRTDLVTLIIAWIQCVLFLFRHCRVN
ncbi:hypothetical protein BDR04DRAFT_344626 [Suillus decipiens]|nr:hypothetical protein BDR04DRAFT_344626 [Suillus decipiens]